jgi:hypothetical protein
MHMDLAPSETVLTGQWIVQDSTVHADDVSRRIEWLVRARLARVAADASGWEVLYRDSRNGRLWELTHPMSEMHGGGPPQLQLIAVERARTKYRVIEV